MTVFSLFGDVTWEGESFLGIFATLERAQAEVPGDWTLGRNGEWRRDGGAYLHPGRPAGAPPTGYDGFFILAVEVQE